MRDARPAFAFVAAHPYFVSGCADIQANDIAPDVCATKLMQFLIIGTRARLGVFNFSSAGWLGCIPFLLLMQPVAAIGKLCYDTMLLA